MRNAILTIVLGLTLVGCATTPRTQVNEPSMAPGYAHGTTLPAAEGGNQVWWQAFGDPTLDDLVARALNGNFDVRIALERVSAGRAVVSEARAGWLPHGGASASGTRQQLSGSEAAGVPTATGQTTRYEAGFDASWELDLFGRLSARVRAARAQALAREEALSDVRLTVAAEVARAYFALIEASESKTLAEQSLARQQSIVDLMEIRGREGYGDPLDEKRARAELSLAVAQVSQAETDAAVANYRLAVLLGENPSTFALTLSQSRSWSLVKIAVGTPQSLLATRPDLRRARAQIAAASARADAVEAEILPRVTLTGFLGLVAGRASALGNGGSESWFVSPAISVPLFDLPALGARIDVARSNERQALLAYHKAVVEALADVESSLRRFIEGQQRLEALRARAEHASAAAAIARARYDAGAADYLVLLEAERTAYAAQLQLARAVNAQRVAAIAVFKAFGLQWLPAGQA